MAQNVGIGTQTPSASAQLEVSSTSSGLLMPRMTTAQRDAIAAPAKGLLIYNLDDNSIDRYDGARWQKENGLTTLDSIAAAGHPTPNSWVRRADAGPSMREDAVAFSIGNKGYMGTGFSSSLLKDFWSYDPLSNTWTQLADFGGAARRYAMGFAIGTKGYIGTGTVGNQVNDFWEYDPSANEWLPKSPVPGGGRTEAVGFSLAGKGYAGLGETLGGLQSDMYQYDPATDTWTAVATWPGGIRTGAEAFTVNGKAYVGLGFAGSAQSTIFPYNPITNTWGPAIAAQTGLNGNGWSSFTLGNKGYLGMGQGSKVLFAYDPSDNTWTAKANYPGNGIRFGIGFAIGNKGYMGTGTTGSARTNDFWEYMDNNLQPLASSLPPSATGAVTDGAWTLDAGTVYKNSPGNVGIGTSSPSTPLEVNGIIKTTALQLTTGAAAGRFLQSDASGNASWAASLTETDPKVGTLTGNKVPKWNGASLVDGLITDNGSLVGIGTTTPTHLFTLVSAGQNTFADGQTLSLRTYSTTSSGWGGGAAFGFNSASVIMGQLSNVATIGGHNATLSAWANLAINPGGGYVGIGTSSPTTRLDVNGTVKTTGFQLTTGAAAGRILQSDASGNASWAAVSLTETDPSVGANTTGFLSKWNGSQLVASTVREDAGNVGIGVAAAANARLQVNSANTDGGSTNWIAANLGISTGNADRLVLGTLNGVPTVGAHKSDLAQWANLAINPGGGTGAGFVGIGLNNPQAKLHVNGSTRLGGQGTPIISIYSQDAPIGALNNLPPGGAGIALINWPQTIADDATIIVTPKAQLTGGITLGYAWKSSPTQISVYYYNHFNSTNISLAAHTVRVTVINFDQ